MKTLKLRLEVELHSKDPGYREVNRALEAIVNLNNLRGALETTSTGVCPTGEYAYMVEITDDA